jgi:hypothetical protein
MTPKAVMSRRVVLAGAAGLVVAGCGAPPPVVVEHQSGVPRRRLRRVSSSRST